MSDILELDEDEFLLRYGTGTYVAIAQKAFDGMLASDMVKAKFEVNKTAYTGFVFNTTAEGWSHIYVEASLEQSDKLPEGYELKLIKLVMMKEQCPDFVLDRINQLKQTNPKLEIKNLP